MNQIQPNRQRTKAALLACGFLSASCFTYAQESESEEVFELSPFTIDASDDQGYNASQTMAGGRLNQSLKNTGAAIQVITKDFMDDLGATGIEELLQYTTSSEVAGILGNFTGADTEGGGEVSTGGARRDPDGAARIRGLAAPDRTRNFFITEIPFDSYNTERIDINRGANSFLFGLGTPAGLINNGLAQARFKDTNEIGARIGSGGKDPSMRANFKINRVLVEDKLAVLVAGLWDRTQYRQRPTYRNDDRGYMAATYRPFGNENTVFQGYIEKGNQIGNAPDVLLPQHNLDTFLDGGLGVNYEPSNLPANPLSPELAGLVARRSIDAYANVVFFNHPEGAANSNNNNAQNRRVIQPKGAWVKKFPNITTDYQKEDPIYRNLPYSESIANFNWGAGALGLVYDGTNGEDWSFGYTPQLRQADQLKGNAFWDPINRNRGNPQSVQHGNKGEIGISGWQDQGFTDLETFDFSRNNLGWDNDFYSRDFYNYNFSLAQTFWEGKGGFNIAYDYQNLQKGSYTAFNGGNSRVIFDINETLFLPTEAYLAGEEFDGHNYAQPNPNYGRPFVLTKSGRRAEDLQDETFRGTAFMKYDFQDSSMGDKLSKILGSHTITFLADKSTSDESFINYTTNSFGDEGYDPGHHIGAANARQSANNVRNTPHLVYIGPQQLNAFTDPDFQLDDFQFGPAKYDLRRPDGEEVDRWVWYLGDDVNAENYAFRGGNSPDNIPAAINGNEDWRWQKTSHWEVPTKNYRLQQTKINSMAVNTQSMLFNNHVVLNMGYREDTIDNWLNTEAYFEVEQPDLQGNILTLDEVRGKISSFVPDSTSELSDAVQREEYEIDLIEQISPNQIASLDSDGWRLNDPIKAKFNSVTSTVFGYGGVVYWPKDIIGLPEWVDDITFHYNTSENFVPATDRVDQYRNKVTSPSGQSSDYGISMYLMNNKVVARFNWYDAFLANDRSPVSNLFNQSYSKIFAHLSQLNIDISRVDNEGGFSDGIVDESFLIADHGYDPELGMNPEEFDEDSGELLEGTGLNKEELQAFYYPTLARGLEARENILPALTPELRKAYNVRVLPNGEIDTQWAGTITDTNDIKAKGFEAEFIINPTKSWRIAFNAAQQETVLTNIAPRLTDLFENTWFPHLQKYGDLDWNEPLSGESGQTTTANVLIRSIDYFVAKSQEGRKTNEQREWRFNAITNYSFRQGPLKGFQIGGAYRWQDEYGSGYPLLAVDNGDNAGFIIPDVNNPFISEAEGALDLTFGYRAKIFNNKVDWRMQINVRNVHNWDNSDLTINKYQPDGSVARVRYAPPRQILLTNTFKF